VGFNPREHSVEVRWTIDAVPVDAGTLQFVVTGLGRWTGEWAFAFALHDLRLVR
jgi:hypothetical protein